MQLQKKGKRMEGVRYTYLSPPSAWWKSSKSLIPQLAMRAYFLQKPGGVPARHLAQRLSCAGASAGVPYLGVRPSYP
jgi:hypothetical protein